MPSLFYLYFKTIINQTISEYNFITRTNIYKYNKTFCKSFNEHLITTKTISITFFTINFLSSSTNNKKKKTIFSYRGTPYPANINLKLCLGK